MTKHIKRKSEPDFKNIMQRRSISFMSTPDYRNMLDNVHPGSHVYAESTLQHGTVIDILRDRYGIPVCLKVRFEELVSVEGSEEATISGIDRISVD